VTWLEQTLLYIRRDAKEKIADCAKPLSRWRA
jgi:hypothetical protein